MPTAEPEVILRDAQARFSALGEALATVVLGQDQVIEQLLWSLLSGGHALLEGAPGLGKTLIIRTLAVSLGLKFKRIQFTPDLMPSDITGGAIYQGQTDPAHPFRFHPGPIFGQLVMADEINRAPPKTQSALLEAMQEGSVTANGQTHALPEPFLVLATENPIEMEGTFPLPEAQLDRFQLKIEMEQPGVERLADVLQATTGVLSNPEPSPVLNAEELQFFQHWCRQVVVDRHLLHWVARVLDSSAPDSATAPALVREGIAYGAGVRGGQSWILAAKARALIDGRPNVCEEDLRATAVPALRHRLVLNFTGESEGLKADDVVKQLLSSQKPKRVEPER